MLFVDSEESTSSRHCSSCRRCMDTARTVPYRPRCLQVRRYYTTVSNGACTIVCSTVARYCEEGPRVFEGALEVNSELKRAQLLFPGELVKPEAFAVDEEGE